MREFVLLIRSEGDTVASLSPQQQKRHVEKVGNFIKRMVTDGRMKAAQPLEMQGSMLSYSQGKFTDGPFNETKEVQYYHILLLIRSEGDTVASLSPQQQKRHVEKVGNFIKRMVTDGRMKAAQPLEMQGSMLSYSQGKFTDGPFNETKEVISGYYHILAKDLAEATEIAKSDPRFEDGEWRIEIRPIMKIDGINE